MRGLALLALLTLPAVAARAQESASFLTLGAGARAAAMGGAFTAAASGAEALAWNPAGLAGMTRPEFQASDAELFANTHYAFLGFAHPARRGAFAANLGYLGQGSIAGRDASGAPTGNYFASDSMAEFGYGASPSECPQLSLGLGAKYLRSVIAEASAQSAALDAGGRYEWKDGWGPGTPTAAVALLNAGPGLKFLDQRAPLPLTIAAGLGYRIPGGLLLDLDLKRRPNAHLSAVAAGAEYPLIPMFLIRAGFASAAAQTDGSGAAGALAGATAGFGVKLASWDLDYSIAPMGELGSAQTFSLTARF